jgi:hypothetical protein
VSASSWATDWVTPAAIGGITQSRLRRGRVSQAAPMAMNSTGPNAVATTVAGRRVMQRPFLQYCLLSEANRRLLSAGGGGRLRCAGVAL